MSNLFSLFKSKHTKAQREKGQECLELAERYMRRGEEESAYWEIESGARLRHPECQYKLAWLVLDKKFIYYHRQTPLELLLDAADSGYSPAVNDVGYLYEHGITVDKDLETALKWYTKAAKLKNINGIYNHGRCLVCGFGCTPNVKKGMELIRAAMESGMHQAAAFLGKMYDEGIGVEKNESEAFSYYHKAADMGNVDASAFIGWCYAEGRGTGQDYKKAVAYYEKGAVGGNSFAQSKLAWCYEYGRGVEEDKVKAFEYFLKAAEAGEVEAQYAVGWDYRRGCGTEENFDKAAYWLTKAAEQGNACAQYELGQCYRFGEGVEENLELAVEWYQKAAEQGNKNGQREYGRCLMYGNGIEKDRDNAFKWYSKAAEQGDVIAMSEIGLAYYFGRGVEISYPLSFKWHLNAAAQEDETSIFWLGKLYEKGQGVEKDDHIAFEWYMIAAKAGYDQAQCAVGRFYREGLGVEKDDVASAVWYEKAARQNNATAQSKIGYYYYQGVGVEKNFATAVMWYRKAAVSNATAQLNLAKCLSTGKGALCNYPEAVHFCQKAVAKEKKGAKEFLEKIEAVLKKDMEMFEKAKTTENLDEAIALAESGIKHGIVEVITFCAELYGQAGNTEKEEGLYKLAADYNDAASAEKYGLRRIESLYAAGRNEKDILEAVKYLEQAGNAGYAESQYQVGLLYRTEGCLEDRSEELRKAEFWIDKAVSSGHKKAVLYRADMAEGKHDMNKAVELYRIAAEWSADARVWMMRWYNEVTSERSGPEVLYWIQRSIQDNSGEAFYRLGLYNMDRGDRDEAYKAFVQAVKLKYYYAYSICAREALLRDTKESREEAVRYFFEGAEEGNVMCFYPAYLLLYNEVNRGNVPEAEIAERIKIMAHYLRGYIKTVKPIDLEIRECSKQFAEMAYTLGFENEALDFYRKAAEYGDVNSAYHVGCAYKNGVILLKDFDKAREYLEMAAKSGHQKAQFELGSMLVSGDLMAETDGTEKIMGIRWLKRAIAQGDIEARQWLLSIGHNK